MSQALAHDTHDISDDIKIELIEIAHKMVVEQLPKKFIASAVETAFEFEGVYDLMALWEEETAPDEKAEIVADIQDMIDECSQKDKVEGVYVKFDDLETIAKDIRQFKDSLRLIVDEKGGINELSQLTGIPQPSISRFFSSDSMPKRITLLKIARALNLDQVQIATKWSR